MPRPGITYLDVAKAATQLSEQKQRPSIEAVRRLLGTGSNSTINHHLREWRKNHGNQIELEQGLPESLLVAVRGIYEAICTEANDKLEKLTSQNKQIISELNLKIESLENINHQLFQERSTLEKTTRQIHEEKSVLERLGAKHKKEINDKTSENNLLNERLKDKKAEIKRVTEQIKHFQANLDHYRETIREERLLEKHTFEKKNSALKSTIHTQQNAVNEAKEKIAALQKQIEFLERQKKEEKNKAEEFFKKYQHEAMASQKINMQHCNLRELYDSLLSESQKLNQRSKQDKGIISELKIGAGKHQERLSMYGDALKKAEENIANLSDKNLFLTQEKAELTGQLKQVFATT